MSFALRVWTIPTISKFELYPHSVSFCDFRFDVWNTLKHYFRNLLWSHLLFTVLWFTICGLSICSSVLSRFVNSPTLSFLRRSLFFDGWRPRHISINISSSSFPSNFDIVTSFELWFVWFSLNYGFEIAFRFRVLSVRWNYEFEVSVTVRCYLP